MTKGRSTSAFLLIVLGALVAPATVRAQYFGQNKVQYKSFHWSILKTEHFDVHYYTGEEEAVQNAAVMAERGYRRLSRVLDHQIKAKIPLVLYASHTDFEQTNITPELLGVGTGGVTEFLKRRVFLPFTGSYAELDHVLTHELVHAFQVDILFGDRQSLVGNPFASSPPGWFMEGMAEYLSIAEIDNNTKMWLRDASLEGYLTPIRVLEYVGDIRVYRFGQSIWQFIADTYGVQKIGEILKRTRRMDKAFESATGLTMDVLSKKWTEAVRKEYLPQIAEHDKPDQIAAKLTDAERDQSNFNVAPSVSPSGTEMVFISDRSMYNDLYLASALDGKVFKKLVEGERTGSFETLRFFNTSIAWAPDEKMIALPAKIGGQDAIYLIEVPSGHVKRKLKFGLDAIYSPTWSPDGKQLAFVGLKAGLSSGRERPARGLRRHVRGARSGVVPGRGADPLLDGRRSRHRLEEAHLWKALHRDPGRGNGERDGAPEPARREHLAAVGPGRDLRRLRLGPFRDSEHLPPGSRDGGRGPALESPVRRLGDRAGEPLHLALA